MRIFLQIQNQNRQKFKKMIFEHQSKNKIALLAVFGLLLLIGILYIILINISAPSERVSCTQEAKQCPDGSYVSRTGSDCEFAACPGGSGTELWKTAADNNTGITFQYPEQLTAEYMRALDWPPKVQVLNTPFSCTEAGTNTSRAGRTEKRTVDDRAYCVTEIVEGAAGSTYTQYAYAFPKNFADAAEKNGKTVIFTFTIQAPQCANYEDPKKTACEKERESFDLDSVVDRMAHSIRQVASLPPAAAGGIKGAVLLGPTCPVVRNPPDPLCADKPYKTTVQIIKTGSAKSSPYATTESNSEGRYEIMLPPGEYALQPIGGNPLPRCETKNVIVESNKIKVISLSCDTGIR